MSSIYTGAIIGSLPNSFKKKTHFIMGKTQKVGKYSHTQTFDHFYQKCINLLHSNIIMNFV